MVQLLQRRPIFLFTRIWNHLHTSLCQKYIIKNLEKHGINSSSKWKNCDKKGTKAFTDSDQRCQYLLPDKINAITNVRLINLLVSVKFLCAHKEILLNKIPSLPLDQRLDRWSGDKKQTYYNIIFSDLSAPYKVISWLLNISQ